MMRLLACCILLFLGAYLPGQTDFQPSRFKSLKEQRLLEKMDARLERDYEGLPKKFRTQYKDIYLERSTNLKTKLTEGHFLFDADWDTWFGNILQEIWRGNPQLPKSEITLFIARYSEPNAASYGEGSLVFNVGLMPFMETESQVAFVLCHEIAHYAQNHSGESIKKYVETLYSDEVQAKLKAISKSEYKQTQQAMDLLKTFTFSHSRHSRFKESEADSLAIIYLSNTKYAPAASLRSLEILDKTDSVMWAKLDYKKYFDAAQFPFNDSWLLQKKSSLSASATSVNAEQEDADSLKTHPDCQKRLAAAKRIVEKTGNLKAGNDFLQPDSVFQKLKYWADLENLEGLYHFERFGRCLFLSLQYLDSHPDDAYVNAMVSKCLFQLYFNQKNHTLGKVLALPSPAFDPEYERFLRFANQFRLKELAQINYYFVENRRERFAENEDFMCAAALASYANELPAEYLKRKKEYTRKYSRGRFTNFLNLLN